MNQMNPHNEVAEQVRSRILSDITAGRFSDSRRLPPENELARQFGVSRNVIRDCMAQLQREGFVSRRPGLGTIINHHVIDAYPRFDLGYDIDSTLNYYGKKADVTDFRTFDEAASERVADALSIAPDDPVIVVECVFAIDGKPSIYCCDYIPKVLIPENAPGPERFMPSIYPFLRESCAIEVYHFISEFHAVRPPKHVAEKLRMDASEPILQLTETGYTFQGQPVIYTEEYPKEGTFPHRVLRQVI